ncbi:MAG: MBL fold metallo-hydrolase, partial [Flavobacterium sp.]|nr:MBL fold metallo-hydrolase [Flavobacterium sp.]
RNILIDGGSEKGNLYETSLRVRINDIINVKKEKIDLWIITHIDDDHIGGVLRLLKDTDLLVATDLSQTTFWFNYSIWDYDSGLRSDNLKSYEQAITLREYLMQNSNVVNNITDGSNKVDLWGATAFILSPDHINEQALLKSWENKEKIIRERKESDLKDGRKNDYTKKIEDFDLSKELKDTSVENGSSIAFVLEHNKERILFMADSHPWVVAASISRLWPEEKLTLKYMQVPHHGSRRNISAALLELIDCEEFIVSADAYNRSNLPNKETFVKILSANPDKDLVFHITQKNALTTSIFEIDTDHNIDVRFPEGSSNFLHFTLG